MFLANLARSNTDRTVTFVAAVSGQYIQAVPTVILAVFIFLGSVFLLYLRARQGPGPYLFGCILGCICLDITLTAAILLPYPYYQVLFSSEATPRLIFFQVWPRHHCSTRISLCHFRLGVDTHIPTNRIRRVYYAPSRCTCASRQVSRVAMLSKAKPGRFEGICIHCRRDQSLCQAGRSWSYTTSRHCSIAPIRSHIYPLCTNRF